MGHEGAGVGQDGGVAHVPGHDHAGRRPKGCGVEMVAHGDDAADVHPSQRIQHQLEDGSLVHRGGAQAGQDQRSVARRGRPGRVGSGLLDEGTDEAEVGRQGPVGAVELLDGGDDHQIGEVEQAGHRVDRRQAELVPQGVDGIDSGDHGHG